jgi:hypothetical protein
MEELRNEEFILLNEGSESDEDGVCYSWPALPYKAGCYAV